MKRFHGVAVLLAAFLLAVGSAAAQERADFDLGTATVSDISAAMDRGALTSERLVELSLARIEAYEPTLNAVITLNPRALEEARALDAERRSTGPRSPLHGVPVLLKDNINTRDLPTTLGFFGLRGAVPYSDALVVARFRRSRAIRI